MTYISVKEVQDQLGIDDALLPIHAEAINRLIGGAVDWAENFTNRSLAELVELNSPRDSIAVPVADPDTNDPSYPGAGWLWNRSGLTWINAVGWTSADYLKFFAANPIQVDHAMPLRRDLKQGLLLWIQAMFDRDPTDMTKLIAVAENTLWPYRRALGV